MTTKRKPALTDYVTREARRLWQTRIVTLGDIDSDGEAYTAYVIRHVLRRAARECETVREREGVNAAMAHHAKRKLVATCREAGEEVATECRDAIRALAAGGRG